MSHGTLHIQLLTQTPDEALFDLLLVPRGEMRPEGREIRWARWQGNRYVRFSTKGIDGFGQTLRKPCNALEACWKESTQSLWNIGTLKKLEYFLRVSPLTTVWVETNLPGKSRSDENQRQNYENDSLVAHRWGRERYPTVIEIFAEIENLKSEEALLDTTFEHIAEILDPAAGPPILAGYVAYFRFPVAPVNILREELAPWPKAYNLIDSMRFIQLYPILIGEDRPIQGVANDLALSEKNLRVLSGNRFAVRIPTTLLEVPGSKLPVPLEISEITRRHAAKWLIPLTDDMKPTLDDYKEKKI